MRRQRRFPTGLRERQCCAEYAKWVRGLWEEDVRSFSRHFQLIERLLTMFELLQAEMHNILSIKGRRESVDCASN